ncbi:FadR/GntR family transcriptional regulator [Arthrobacter sp. ATA002]|uniref:FadR/GntR family transcriptional regulator n=1 Tax=Arthrobacter sp. ATA002 TaxID=2991715 RepID=UPI002E361E6B|nr:FCD domain-containing protein [Arthrobacter sp. ATA002]
MIETGAAFLAAGRRTAADVELLAKHLAGMEAASAAADVDAFVREDIAFHDVVLRASGNVLVPAMYEPLNRLLANGRRETSAVPVIQEHAIAMHRQVLDAIAAGSGEEARLAMDRHMDQTQDDLVRHVLARP